jgi:hypothetical protein
MSMIDRTPTWSDLAHAVWRIMTAKPDAVVWTEYELAAATGTPRPDVAEALDELFLEGDIQPAVPHMGWRRA